jgi:RimJ/RimL family protein N-acetyltransferase
MNYGRTSLELRRIVATTAPGNCGSIHVLEKLGLRFERTFRLEGARKRRPVCKPLRDNSHPAGIREIAEEQASGLKAGYGWRFVRKKQLR